MSLILSQFMFKICYSPRAKGSNNQTPEMWKFPCILKMIKGKSELNKKVIAMENITWIFAKC